MLTVNGIQFSDVPPEDRTVFALADRGRLSDLLVELKTLRSVSWRRASLHL
ncbi:MAG: hypothetical protein LKE39_11115 [Sphaerochaeta sp.]|jgi:hypothetical protein|nr:hypothetical protein [Sphaerochaeta sp.]